MAAPSLAWGELHLFQFPDGNHIYGREFELLPAGTMFAAAVILHGLVGIPARINSEQVAIVAADAIAEMWATRGTNAHELEAYEPEILESFRLRQLQEAES